MQKQSIPSRGKTPLSGPAPSREATALSTKTSSNLKALCALSETPTRLNPDKLSRIINDAPDPATAIRTVLDKVPADSDVLIRKWRQLAVDLWSQHHPHIPVLLDLPITTGDVADVPAVQDAQTFLRLINNKPAHLIKEGKEWLLAPEDAYFLATSLPSQRNRPLVQIENEWQSLPLRRLRTTLQTLKLVRRLNNELVIVKSRYQRFCELPLIQQYYLLWHTEVYHISWSEFSGIWGEYLGIIQECLPLLWDISEGTLPDIPYDIRQWNQDVWDTFEPLWDQEGLLERQRGDSVLLSYVRTHSIPTAITQVIMRDLFEHFGLLVGEGELYVWTTLGTELTEAERTQDLPCALDLIK